MSLVLFLMSKGAFVTSKDFYLETKFQMSGWIWKWLLIGIKHGKYIFEWTLTAVFFIREIQWEEF